MGRKKNPTSDMDVREKKLTTLAQRLDELITDSGALKEHLGVSIQAINQYRQGTARPTLENLCKIADFYGVTTDYLLGRTEIKTTDKDMATAVKTTGLCEEAVKCLAAFLQCGQHFKESANHFLCTYNFRQIIDCSCKYRQMLEDAKALSCGQAVESGADLVGAMLGAELEEYHAIKALGNYFSMIKKEVENDGKH